MRELLEKILRVNEVLHTGEWGFIDLSGRRITDIKNHEYYAVQYLKKHRGPNGRFPTSTEGRIATFLKATGWVRYYIENEEVGFSIVAPVNSIQVRTLRRIGRRDKDVLFDILDKKGDSLLSGVGFSDLISSLKNMDLLEKISEFDIKKGLRTAAAVGVIGAGAVGLGYRKGLAQKDVVFPAERPAVAAPIEEPTPTATEEEPTVWQTVRMRVTAYCPCEICCGPDAEGITASGHEIQEGDVFIAADKRYSFGTKMIVPGYNDDQPAEVLDRGGAIKGDRIDVFFPTHDEALEWGVKNLDVKIRG